ncbi:MAG: DUF2780 domain-containing protein [Dehalococcoidia bacterium]|nr:DUF2780 domain-containing protein [Dehalococcoidia bacterium]MDD5493227.1 DUF2780 domain-containing protein [Dehalococcoidia bacterium]
MELIDLLVKNLGVNDEQAKGGTGLIFSAMKEKVQPDDFAKIAELVPGIGTLMKAAPAQDSGGGGMFDMVGKLASSLGGDSQLGKLGQLASLAGGFEKLGLDPSMVNKFLPLIMTFLQNKGGDEIGGLLKGLLK